MAAQPAARRIRRQPEDAEREILDAAEQALGERPFRDLSVDELMARTGMRRSSFYHYFRSIDEVAVALLARVQSEMIAAATPSLAAAGDDPAGSLRRGLREIAAVFARHGAVLAAIHEASFHHAAVERAWRHGILEEWIAIVAGELRAQREHGLTRVEDPDELARALLLMNTAVMVERLGRRPPEPPEAVADTLARVWVGAIYPEALA